MNAADRGVLLLLWDGIRDYINRWRDDDRAFAAFAEGMPADIKLPAGYVARLRILSIDEIVASAADELTEELGERPFGVG